jgi:signal transduction histidine kinase
VNDEEKTREQLMTELQQLRHEHKQYKATHAIANLWRKVIQQSPTSVQVLNKNGFTISVNEAHQKTFNDKPPKDYCLFNDPILLDQGLAEWFEKLRNGEMVIFPDTKYNPHDFDQRLADNTVWVKSIGLPMVDAAGKPVRFVIMHENITESKMLKEKLQKSNEQLHYITTYIHQTEEIERKKLSAELHDVFIPTLAAIKNDLDDIQKRITDVAIHKTIDINLEYLSQLIKNIRNLTSRLRPEIIEQLGIKGAIHSMIEKFTQKNNIGVSVDVDNDLHLPDNTAMELYRIAESAFNNIEKHSKAKKAGISLKKTAEGLKMMIYDNGIGITNQPELMKDKFGLKIMNERALRLGGDFSLSNEEGKGTTIVINIPIVIS